MTRALFIAGHNTVIIDATNITPDRRDVWKKKFPGADIDFKIFPLLVESCIERAKTDDREDLIPIIERMAKYADFSC